MSDRRILIVRLSAIGDTIHSLPLAAAIRRLFPDCHLGWLVEKPSAQLVEHNPLLDWWQVVPKGWMKKPALVWQLRQALREQHFDTAIDIQGLTKSAFAALLSGAPIRIGFSKGEGRELAPYLDNWLIRPNGVHAVDITLALLQGLGERLDRWDLQPEFIFPPCSEEDHRRIGVALEEMDLPASYAVMGPWGSFTSKLWPVERFVELAARLEQKLGMPSLILGHGIRERGAVAGLLAKREGLRSRIAPELTLPGVVELARGARLFVGSDSFPMHAAAAAGTPTIGLFGITDPQRLGPYGKNGRAVYAAITLVKSTRERRRLGQENMLALTVDQVEEEVFNLLEPKPYL